MIWQNKKPSVLSYAEHFWWARVDVASRAAKNSLAGCFCPAGRKAPGRSCSHPPAYVSLTFAQKKTASVSLHQRFFHGRGWIRTTEAEKQQIYSLSPLATREHAHILLCVLPDDLFILAWKDGFVNTFLQISAGIFPSRDPDKKAPSGLGKRAPDGAWKHMLFSYRSLKNQ